VRRRRAKIAVACALLAFAGGARAETRVVASVDRTRIGEQDTLVLTVRAEGEEAGRVEAPSLAGVREFRLLRGPSVSTQFQWVNGRASSAKSWTYVLMPRRTGRLLIPALELEKGSEVLRTEPVEVEVVAGTLGPAPGRGRPLPLRPPASEGGEAARVEVDVEADRERAYVGQQVTLTYRIYSQAEITGIDLVDVPAYPGFWVEDLKVDANRAGRRAVRQGEEYLELTVMRKALFATRSGTLEIPPLTFSIGVRASGGDPFESLFFGTGRTIYRKSPALRLEVRPLPEEGKPAAFGGAVGRYRLHVSPDRQEAAVNDAISLRVRVEGEGNVRPIAAPRLPELPDFRAYDPKVDEKTSTERERLRGSKVWDFVLLPLAPGVQEIPPVEFAYFEPDSGRYHTLRSSPIRVQVARAEAEPGASAARVEPREVRQLRADIRHLKPVPPRLQARRPLTSSPAFAAALIAPAAANLLVGAAAWRRARQQGEQGSLRRRRALREARRALRGAAALAEGGAAGEFYDAVARALRQYVADRLDRSAAGLTMQEIEEALGNAGVAPADRIRLLGCLEACDRGRFTPASGRPQARRELVEQARAAVDSLQGRL
jgi:hypothetical protein